MIDDSGSIIVADVFVVVGDRVISYAAGTG